MASCGDVAGTARVAAVRDSAGVRIVENRGRAWSDGGGWKVGTPGLSVGGGDVAAEYQLYEVHGATRFSDGRIVVANSGSHQLRFFDASGTYLESAGHEGQGPGEFGHIWRMERYRGDSLLVWDSRNQRLSVHDLHGRFVRDFKLAPGAGGIARFPGRDLVGFGDGSILGVEWLGQQLMAAGPGVLQAEARFFRFDPNGEQVDSIGSFPWMEYYVGDEQVVMPNGAAMARRAPLMFGRTLYLAAADSSFWVGTGDAGLSRYDLQGRLVQRVRRTDLSRDPATPATIEREIEARLAAAEEMNSDPDFLAGQRRLLEDMPAADSLPAYEGMMVDADGNLWTKHYTGAESPEEDSRSSSWDVFEATGRYLGTVELPDRFEPFEIGEDYVLGVQKDELDIERLLLLPLDKET
jgi:hypothetical protein